MTERGKWPCSDGSDEGTFEVVVALLLPALACCFTVQYCRFVWWARDLTRIEAHAR